MEYLIHNLGKIILTAIGAGLLIAAIKNFKKIEAFLTEVKVELSKVTWSTRHELIGATGVVIVITLMMALYIGAADYSLSRMLTLLIK